ncbi:MAG: peptidase [Bacteroidetes bacterium]|nr:peptidase [Bacteroidota bacterium]
MNFAAACDNKRMGTMKWICVLFLIFSLQSAMAPTPVNKGFHDDFDFFWNTIKDNYSYFDQKKIDWDKVKMRYAPQADTASTRNVFIGIIENALYELYDHHCTLNTNTPASRRLVPTGADIWAAYVNGKPTVTEIRKGFGAERTGMITGMEIIAVNDVPVEKAIAPFMPHSNDAEAKNFALRLLLAGDHQTKRKITAKDGNVIRDFFPDQDSMQLDMQETSSLVFAKQYGNIIYIRINNCLFNNDLIPAFDSVLNAHFNSSALILDLRETPSGGNSSVARAIMGRFISKEMFYQKHEYVAEEKETGIKRSWEEIVTPRGRTYVKPVVVLADHWTGSMGEGITIGFAGMNRATVIGTPMAALLGATYGFEMPNTKINFHLPAEKLFTVQGLPREQFIPVPVKNLQQQNSHYDPILQQALQYLQHH